MSEQTSPPGPPKPYMAHVMWIVGVIALVAIGLYYGYQISDSASLASQQGQARVVDKGYQEAGQSYFTQVIGKQRVVRPVERPEMYLLRLQIGGSETVATVPKSLYDEVGIGDEVQVTYQKRRLSGALQVVKVNR